MHKASINNNYQILCKIYLYMTIYVQNHVIYTIVTKICEKIVITNSEHSEKSEVSWQNNSQQLADSVLILWSIMDGWSRFYGILSMKTSHVQKKLYVKKLQAIYLMLYKLGTCESFFSFESNLESNRPSDSFSNRIFESNRPYTTQAVTQPNGLHAYRTACYTYSEYLIHRYFVFVTNESDVQTTELRTEYLFISIQS